MGNLYRWRWLLLAGVAALAGCAQLSGDAANLHCGPDPRQAYSSPGPDLHIPAESQGLEAHWAAMSEAVEAEAPPTPVVATAAREQPIVRAAISGPSKDEQTAPAPAGNDAGATKRRTLWDKQPWETELDKIVRGICRGC